MAVGCGVGLVVLAGWPLTDRLDVLKQLILLLVGGLVVVAGLSEGRHAASSLVAGLGVLAIVGLAGLSSEMGARVEGLAGWGGALLLGWGAARAHHARLARWLGATGAVVAAVAVLQGLGLDLFGGTRVISGTLGGPGHLGWTLALLLPFCLAWGPRAPWLAGLMGAALVLSGSRTGWVMVLVGLPWWALGGGREKLRRALLIGCALGIGIDVVTRRADLAGRVADLADEHGTTAGRGYLLRLYASHPGAWLGAGHGPEGFVRRFPELQRAWLGEHPADRPFRSDLRHAHVDLVEVGFDFGLVGIALLLWGVGRSVRWRPLQGAPGAVLVSAAVGGCASPVLFFAPTLAVGAVAVGMRRPAPRSLQAGGILPLLVASMIMDAMLVRRVASETLRSEATWSRLSGRPAAAREVAGRALEVDARNPRAWAELGLACEALGDRSCACVAWQGAAEDLPTDGVLARCQ